MKTSKEPDAYSVEFAAKLKKRLSETEIASLLLTIFGMSELAHEFIYEEVLEFIELPIRIRYSLLQHAAMYALMRRIAQDHPDDTKTIEYLPCGEGAWESNEDFEQRFIHIVKGYYNSLKKEGKITE